MTSVDYLSLFSGIEAASVAWAPLGWRPLAFAEVDAFPSAVLRERFPSVPNLGDVTKVNWRGFVKDFGRPDVLVGGSPCQSFSIAGTRTGLGGASGLMWEYVRAVREVRPRWLLWENVPGALSSTHGEDFGCLLRSLDALGYGLAWRVLDAQFFGVAQRRERVFLVGRLGDPGGPCQVLFEPDCLSWNPPQGREKRKELAAAAGRSTACAGFKYSAGSGANGIGHEEESCNTLIADWHAPGVYPVGDGCLNPADPQSKRVFDPRGVAPTLSSGTREGMNIQPSVLCMADTQTNSSVSEDGAVGTITSHSKKDAPVTAFAQNTRDEVRVQGDGTLSGALSASPGMKQTTYVCMADDNANSAVDVDMAGTIKVSGSAPMVSSCRPGGAVRRLTPRECERLQGFEDDWTRIPWRGRPAEECPDGPRYKAIGNSMAVPVMRWLGERIAMADEIPPEEVKW